MGVRTLGLSPSSTAEEVWEPQAGHRGSLRRRFPMCKNNCPDDSVSAVEVYYSLILCCRAAQGQFL